MIVGMLLMYRDLIKKEPIINARKISKFKLKVILILEYTIPCILLNIVNILFKNSKIYMFILCGMIPLIVTEIYYFLRENYNIENELN